MHDKTAKDSELRVCYDPASDDGDYECMVLVEFDTDGNMTILDEFLYHQVFAPTPPWARYDG
jgi:hypothetical protein